jgi:hypothetical protein
MSELRMIPPRFQPSPGVPGGLEADGPVGIGTSPVANVPLTVAAGTQTTAVPALSVSQTANAAAVAFPGVKVVMTEGAAGTAAATTLLDLQYGAAGAEASKFSVSKAGTVNAAGAIQGAGIIQAGTIIRFGARSGFKSSVDGKMELYANDGTTPGTLYAASFAASALPTHANNAAALAGGLVAGQFYRTGGDPDLVCVVH